LEGVKHSDLKKKGLCVEAVNHYNFKHSNRLLLFLVSGTSLGALQIGGSAGGYTIYKG